MNSFVIIAESYFDGTRHHADGPFTIEVHEGVIEQVIAGDATLALGARYGRAFREPLEVLRAPFLMPGLTEAHCHLFLDGNELDFQKRKEYLRAPFDEMLAVGRRNVTANLAAGIT